MSIKAPLFEARRSVRYFTVIWICATTVVSIYFSFWLFPYVYAKRTSAVVGVSFQTKVSQDGASPATVYYPNLALFRTQQGSALSDTANLYYSSCELLPPSQRPICDRTRNWIKLAPEMVGCSNVAACTVETHQVDEDERLVRLAGVTPLQGANFSISELESSSRSSLSLSDPTGWGMAARLPIFFICLFLGLKLGRSVGEFIFTPYEK